jgi:hypothetical protein
VGAGSAGVGVSGDGGIGAGGGTGGMLAGGGGGGAGGIGGFCASSEPVSSNDPTAMKGSNGLRDFMIDTPCQNEGSNVVDMSSTQGMRATVHGHALTADAPGDSVHAGLPC